MVNWVPFKVTNSVIGQMSNLSYSFIYNESHSPRYLSSYRDAPLAFALFDFVVDPLC